jgi:large subunit ribosomal protein L6
MSRIGKMPVTVPTGVEVAINSAQISVKGSLGSLVVNQNTLVKVENNAGTISFAPADESREANAMSGTMRQLVNNMVNGVSKGFERKLELVGVGYRAAVQGRTLNLTLGFSHPVAYAVPEGITIETPSQTEILIKGIDRQRVGQVAAEIREFRSPEPYKGKGVRYAGEKIALKEGKKK